MCVYVCKQVGVCLCVNVYLHVSDKMVAFSFLPFFYSLKAGLLLKAGQVESANKNGLEFPIKSLLFSECGSFVYPFETWSFLFLSSAWELAINNGVYHQLSKVPHWRRRTLGIYKCLLECVCIRKLFRFIYVKVIKNYNFFV